MEALNINKTQSPEAASINRPPWALKQLVEGTQAVSVMNAEKWPWFTIGLFFGFGFLVACAIVGVVAGILFAIMH